MKQTLKRSTLLITLLFTVTSSAAFADCESLYRAKLFPAKKSKGERVKDETGNVVIGTAGSLALADAAASGLAGVTAVSIIAAPAAVAIPVFVWADMFLSRKRTRIEVGRWILKESHPRPSLNSPGMTPALYYEEPSAFVGVIGHWTLSDLSKHVVKNKEIQRLHPDLSAADVAERVADLDHRNVFCQVRFAEQEDIYMIVLASFGAVNSAAEVQMKIEHKNRNNHPELIGLEMQKATELMAQEPAIGGQ